MAEINYHFICGLDIGNGYTKAKFDLCDGSDLVTVDMPSAASYTSANKWISTKPSVEDLSTLCNSLDCTVDSETVSVGDRKRIYLGERAVHASNRTVIFNLEDSVPKCDDSLSGQIIMGVIAGVAVEKYLRDNHLQLPLDTIHVSCTAGLALPIQDYIDHRDNYKYKLTNKPHHVTIHNYETPVNVLITFDDVEVLAEGAAAQYAINALGGDFLDVVIEGCRRQGAVLEKDLTGDELISYENVLTIDIGSGTVNFAAFNNGKLAVENSANIKRGYESVLEDVVKDIRNTPSAPQTRKELSDFMLKAPEYGPKGKLKAKFQGYIDNEAEVFCRELLSEYKSIVNRTKLQVDAIYVIGGGATPLRNALYPALMESSNLGDDIYLPVLYLDSYYSRNLNRNGLFDVAKSLDAYVHQLPVAKEA